MDKEFKRRRWIVRKKYKDWTNREIASHLRISKRTVQRWWNIYQKQGLRGLEVKSRRPQTIHRTSEIIVNQVLAIRQKEGYGPDKIAGMLRIKGVKVSHNTAYRIICANGLNNPIQVPRRIMGKTRFERAHSNSLWQADFKQTDEDDYMISFLDDHSRFVVGSRINATENTEDALNLLEKCIKHFSCPVQILTDRGTQFWNNRGPAPTAFTQLCADNGIQHIVASVRRPTTTGKVERWHRTFDEEHAKFSTHAKFVKYYNYTRPHQALGYKVPAEIYFKDLVSDM